MWPRAALGAALALAGLLFIAWTSNQKAIGVPLVFAAAGCTAAAFQMLSRQQRALGRRRLALALFVPVPLLATLCAFDARSFGREIDATRKVNDLASLWTAVRAAGPAGAEVRLTLARGTKQLDLAITSADRARHLKAPRLH